jgi:hypothetical protein
VVSLSVMDYIVLTFLYILIGSIIAVVAHMYRKQVVLRQLLPIDTKTSKELKILSVVAGENLDTREIEKSLYTTGIQYNLLSYSSVSQESLLAELDKNVTVFELSSHGLNGKFRLGNLVIPVSWLRQVLSRCHTLECVLLLYCNSFQDIEQIASIGKHTIGLVGDVPDSSCIIFARQFYYYLSKNYSYREAFDVARLSLPVEDFAEFLFSDGRNTNVR